MLMSESPSSSDPTGPVSASSTFFRRTPCDSALQIVDEEFRTELAQLKQHMSPDPEVMRTHLHIMCEEARRCTIRCEEVLIALSQLWDALPPPDHPRNATVDADIRRRLVSAVLDEYYGTHA